MRLTKHSILLIIIILVAAILRFAAINIHSLWWDELQSVRTSDPINSFADIARICQQSFDPAPRTFYFALNIWFRIFGYNDVSARVFTVLFSIAAIPVMYQLGKQLQDKQLGLIAALLTAINYYQIYYSLDVRFYSLLFFFSAASYLFFLRSLARNSIQNLVIYGLVTLSLMLLHYFGILIFVTQGITWMFFYWRALIKNYRTQLRHLITFSLIVLIYLPFTEGLFKTLHTETAALSGNPGSYFFVDYFKAFFGFSGVTVIPAAIVFLFFVMVAFVFQENRIKATTALMICLWILVAPALAYTRTLLDSPTMGERYFIIVLPAILIAASLGVNSIVNSLLKFGFLTFYFFASVISLIAEHRFYSSTVKDDFRGVVRFIEAKENANNFYVVSDKNWHFKYYFDQYKSHPSYIELQGYSDSRFYLTKEVYTEEKLIGDSAITHFWLISAHFANLEKMKSLSNQLLSTGNFLSVDSFDSKDAFARLLVRKNALTSFSYSVPLPSVQLVDLDKEKVLPIWDGEIELEAVQLPKAKYTISIVSKGTAVAGIYAHVNVFANGVRIGDYISTPQFQRKSFHFEAKSENVALKLQMDNDLYDPAKHEDRNIFVRNIILNKEQ